MAFNFKYYTPTKVVFGKGTEEQAGKLIREMGGTRVLLHYGSGSVIRSGLLDKVKKVLEEEQLPFVELGGVVPNPRISLAYEGIELVKKEKLDFILAVGGGSVMDSAKAIGYGVYNGGDVWDFYDKKRKAAGCLPIGAIVTIAATGSEMSDSSVMNNENGQLKRGYSSDFGRPSFAIMNPELTMTLPDYQTACGCADIMMHTMERYFVSGDTMEITDTMAEALLRTVMKNALILKEDPKNYDARAEVMWAGSLSHNGLTGCGIRERDFATHGLEHELGAVYDVAHGAGLTALWGSWARYVYKDCLHRFVRFAVEVIGVAPGGTDEETALRGIEKTEEFFHAIGMPVTLHELGIDPSEEDLHMLAAKCSVSCGGKRGSAKVLYEDDMYQVYKMAAER